VLLVPSLINRWYVLDLCRGYSLAAALADAGLDVYALDWGVFADDERAVGWDALLGRLERAVGVVQRNSGGERPHLLGYSIAGTLAASFAAVRPRAVRTLSLLCAPVDFARAGGLARMVDPRWFDADLATAGGNVPPWRVLAGFAALQPRLFVEEAWAAQRAWLQPAATEAARSRRALRLAQARWLYDGVPFPAAAFRTVVRDFYQRNALWTDAFRALGERVDLAAIATPTLLVTGAQDVVCPADATTALAARLAPGQATHLGLSGAHLTAVAGERAPEELYPALAEWLLAH
jgi:polyhydroxyalkanoate synthase